MNIEQKYKLLFEKKVKFVWIPFFHLSFFSKGSGICDFLFRVFPQKNRCSEGREFVLGCKFFPVREDPTYKEGRCIFGKRLAYSRKHITTHGRLVSLKKYSNKQHWRRSDTVERDTWSGCTKFRFNNIYIWSERFIKLKDEMKGFISHKEFKYNFILVWGSGISFRIPLSLSLCCMYRQRNEIFHNFTADMFVS